MTIPALPPKPVEILQGTRVRQTLPPDVSAQTLPAAVDTLPNIDSKFLEGRNREELEALLNDPELLDAVYLTQHPLPSQYAKDLEDLEMELQQKRARLEAIRSEVLEKRFEAENSLLKTKELEQRWEDVEREMYLSLKPTTSAALFSNLQSAVAESERISETMVTSFLDTGPALDNDGVQEFIKEYRQARKLYHSRFERLARWKDNRVVGLQ